MNRNFKLLLAGQAVSQVGDKFHTIAMAFWVLDTTGSSAKMGLVLAASLVPALIMGVVSGAVIDRYSRKTIIVGTDLIRGCLILAFAWAMGTCGAGFYTILLLQVLLSVNAAFFDPCIPAVIPGVVPGKDLARANAVHQAVGSFALVGGAALGGVAVAGLGYVWVFALNGISFLVSALLEVFIKIPRADSGEQKAGLVSDIRDGYRYLAVHRSLVTVLLMVCIIHFFVGGIEVFMPLIASGLPGGGPKMLGIFQAALGGGTLVSALVLSWSARSEDEVSALFFSVAVMGAIQVAAWICPRAGSAASIAYALCFFLWGAAMVRAAVAFRTLIQIQTEDRFAGRVFALASTIGNASVPAAMMVFGALAGKADAGVLMPASGLVLCGTGCWFTRNRRGYDAKKQRTGEPQNSAGSDRGADGKTAGQGAQRPG